MIWAPLRAVALGAGLSVFGLAVSGCGDSGTRGGFPNLPPAGEITSPVNVSVGLSSECAPLRVGELGAVHVDLIGDTTDLVISWIVDGRVDTRDVQTATFTTGPTPSGQGRVLRAQLEFVPTHVGEVVMIKLRNPRLPDADDETQVVGTGHACQVTAGGQ